MANNGGQVPHYGGNSFPSPKNVPQSKGVPKPRQTNALRLGKPFTLPATINTPPSPPKPKTRTVTRVTSVKGPGGMSGYTKPTAVPRVVKVKAHTRTVTPKAAPVARTVQTAGTVPVSKPLPPTHDKPVNTPAPPTSGSQQAPDYSNLLLYPGQSPAQLAQQALAPQYSQVAQQTAAEQEGLKQFTQAMLAQLGQYPTQVGQDYQQAADQINSYGQQAAQIIAALNPNGQNQQLLGAAGAPAAQQAQLAGQNQTSFGGGSANLYAANGLLPAQTLQNQKAAALSYAQSIPQVQALSAEQAAKNLLYQAGQQRASIAAQAPGLANQYAAAQADSAAKAAGLSQNAQALGLKTATINPSVSKGLGYAANAQGQPITDQSGQPIKWKTVGVSAAAGKKVNSFLSKQVGIAVTANGTPIRTPDGKIIPVSSTGTASAPKVPTASQIGKLVDGWRNGKVETVRVQATDKNGQPAFNPSTNAPIYVSKSVQTGQVAYQQAYSRLRAMGIPDAKARQYLNTAYPRGTQGRSWVSNPEQAVLAKAGLSTRARIIKGHGVLTARQVAALRKAGMLPPGQATREGFYVIANGY